MQRNNSESAPIAKGRGRPCVVPPYMKAIIQTHLGASNPRTIADHHFRLHAINVLRRNGRDPCWLMDFAKMKAGEGGAWRPAILSQLGRIEDVDELLVAADELCRLKPGTKDAVVMLRARSSGRSLPSSDDHVALLVGAIKRAIKGVRAKCTDIQESEVIEALQRAWLGQTRPALLA